MSCIIWLIVALLIFFGRILFVRGRNGRQLDLHPVCRRCKFDLFGRPTGSVTCPECGTKLLSNADIQTGNRQRRNGLYFSGLAMMATGGVLALLGIAKESSFNFVALEPTWLLLRTSAAERPTYRGLGATNTPVLLQRVQAGNISDSDAKAIVTTALKLQADLSRPWNPAWGDMIEALHGAGKVSAEDWKTYLSQDEPATLKVRANCGRGDPIAFKITGEWRGASDPKTLMPFGSAAMTASVAGLPGSNRIEIYGGSGTMAGFEYTGHFVLKPDQWQHLSAGPQTANLTLAGHTMGMVANPALFAPINLQAKWNLLPDGQTAVPLYKDESTAAEAEKTLNCRVERQFTDQAEVLVKCSASPVDLAFDVILRQGDREWKSSYSGWIFHGVPHSELRIHFNDVKGLAGNKTDVILRPNVSAAAQNFQTDRLLDHAFVFKDVSIH